MFVESQSAGCSVQVQVLNDVLAVCPGALSDTLTCDTSTQIGTIFLAVSDKTKCEDTAIELNAALKAFRGPTGTDANLECGFETLFLEAADCNSVNTLNDMIEAFESGSFQDCITTMPPTLSPSVSRPF